MRNGCECAFKKKSRAITPRTIDLSNYFLDGHHSSIVVHIYYKFHEILLASY